MVIFEHGTLYNMAGELPEEPEPVDIAHAAVRRPGTDVTLIGYGGTVGRALAAADDLAGQGIDAEVLDLRVLRPLDDEAVLGSVARTHRAVVVDEGWRSVGIAAEVSARIAEGALYELDAPVARVCRVEVPVPYPKHLEDAALPQVADVVAAARRAVGEDA